MWLWNRESWREKTWFGSSDCHVYVQQDQTRVDIVTWHACPGDASIWWLPIQDRVTQVVYKSANDDYKASDSCSALEDLSLRKVFRKWRVSALRCSRTLYTNPHINRVAAYESNPNSFMHVPLLPPGQVRGNLSWVGFALRDYRPCNNMCLWKFMSSSRVYTPTWHTLQKRRILHCHLIRIVRMSVKNWFTRSQFSQD